MKQVAVPYFLEHAADRTVIDVRTPAEFAQGHIPGAKNLPLFSDEERVVVGTLYKKTGPEAAFLEGLDMAGAKLSWYVKEAMRLSPNRKISIHCWRGGKRSGSLATLLHFAGFDLQVLTGGYKAYRTHVLEQFSQRKLRFVVLGGKTGSGKTEVLHQLAALGEQVVDLEGLAHHKGSAFGSLGELPQPTTEHFENELFARLEALDPQRRIWVENESRSIGRVFVPPGIWEQMKSSPLLHLELPFELRVQRLILDYGGFTKEELEGALAKIEKRLGGQHVKAAKEALDAGDLVTATGIALHYYDKSYTHATSLGNFSLTVELPMDEMVPASAALALQEVADTHLI